MIFDEIVLRSRNNHYGWADKEKSAELHFQYVLSSRIDFFYRQQNIILVNDVLDKVIDFITSTLSLYG